MVSHDRSWRGPLTWKRSIHQSDSKSPIRDANLSIKRIASKLEGSRIQLEGRVSESQMDQKARDQTKGGCS